jgi:multidrug resistance efflux pump
VGIVEHSEAAVAEVTTKFSGWVEKLYVDATGQHVHRGDPLFEIYSPELYSAQVEYLLALGERPAAERGALESGEAAPTLDAPDALRSTTASSALTKLSFFDISEEQIAELARTRTPSKTLRIVAPIDGYVMKKMVVEWRITTRFGCWDRFTNRTYRSSGWDRRPASRSTPGRTSSSEAA